MLPYGHGVSIEGSTAALEYNSKRRMMHCVVKASAIIACSAAYLNYQA